VQYYRYAKTESWAREQEKRTAEHARARHEARDARLERMEREREANLRRKKESLAKKPAAGTARTTRNAAAGGPDPMKAAIEAAKKRAAAKKASLAAQGVMPRNTQGLSPAQQRQIDAAEARRRAATPHTAETAGED
jgi:electron transport complex protein RnfC